MTAIPSEGNNRACCIIPFTRGYTPGYILPALRTCGRAKRFFALHEKAWLDV
jgi:hypothetical protein